MQPKPMAGFILAKEKKAQDIINLGFEVPQTFGRDERAAKVCEVLAVGEPTLEQKHIHASLHELVDATNINIAGCEAGDVIAYAPFSDLKVTIGTDEWLFIEFKSVVGNFGKLTK